MFPIAWAVVKGEKEETWLWFLTLLFEEFNIRDGIGWTFISDQQKVINPTICYELTLCFVHI